MAKSESKKKNGVKNIFATKKYLIFCHNLKKYFWRKLQRNIFGAKKYFWRKEIFLTQRNIIIFGTKKPFWRQNIH
jgi:hypothetical protein